MNKLEKKIRLFLIPISHRLKERILRRKWYKKDNAKSSFVGLISCVDGRLWHGGLTDRFKGIISTFAFCRQNDIPFRIKYDYPFKLEDYLIPNQYDWRLKEGEFSTNYDNSEILYLVGESKKKRYRIPKRTQIHVYANRDATLNHDNLQWGELFKSLFQPSDTLKKAISELDFGKYIAVVFRFQNLLGDFPEYDFKPLDEEGKKKLLIKCEKAVDNFLKQYKAYNVLVTSDSISFLNMIKEKERVRIIPGKVSHVDNKVEHKNGDTYLKSFVDFFMISKAIKVFGVGTKYMYPSGFPKYAAKVNNIPFERVIID